MLAKHILTHYFADSEGAWPGWYRGVTSMYSGEIAVNHCAPDAQRSALLDAGSDWDKAITDYPHIHCWHTEKVFSKHRFMGGGYNREDVQDLDMNVIRDYCLALSFQSLDDLEPPPVDAPGARLERPHETGRSASISDTPGARWRFW
jgi:hypothetical protein